MSKSNQKHPLKKKVLSDGLSWAIAESTYSLIDLCIKNYFIYHKISFDSFLRYKTLQKIASKKKGKRFKLSEVECFAFGEMFQFISAEVMRNMTYEKNQLQMMLNDIGNHFQNKYHF